MSSTSTVQQRCGGNLLRDGQGQGQRLLPALDPASAPVDDRDLQQWLDFSAEYAKLLNFINPQTNKIDGNWSVFFAQLPADLAKQLAFDIDLDAVEASFAAQGDLPPHLGLLISFLRLCRHARTELNGITARHLEYFYRQVLQLKSAAATPDRVHLLFKLKKQVAELLLKKGTLVSAGKDARKKDIQYRLVNDLSVFPITIDSLRSVFVAAGGNRTIKLAPIANSADGLGAEFETESGQWPPFGSSALPQAQVGFAFAAPVLAMAEGVRSVSVELALSGLPHGLNVDAAGQNAFQVYLTGSEGWIGPKTASLRTVAGKSGRYQIEVSLTADEAAVVDYAAELHGHRFDSSAPLLQLLLNQQKTGFGYAQLQSVKVSEVEIKVAVEAISGLQLESDFGQLDPLKPFLPFGPQAKPGATFYVGCAEAFNKQLVMFSLKLKWLNAPVSFSSVYNAAADNYVVSNNRYFKARLTSKLGGQETRATVELFDADNAAAEQLIRVPDDGSNLPPTASKQAPLQQAKQISLQQTDWAIAQVQQMQLVSPIHWYYPQLFSQQVSAPRLRDGFVSLRLVNDFLHSRYTEVYTKRIVAGGTISLPNQPYAPTLESLRLSYTATSGKIDLSAAAGNDPAFGQLSFFQVAPFGQRRDATYLRNQLDFLPAKTVSLLPEYPHEGEFYLGFSGIDPGRNLSLLFQMAEGSGAPDFDKPEIRWSVLSDNHWYPLAADELLSDDSNGLLTSGVIRFKLPEVATNRNSLLPNGHYWLRAAVSENSAAISRLIDVQPNAVQALFKDQQNAPERLRQPLVAKSIAKLVVPVAGIKTVSQPYASFGGRMAEDDRAFRVRVSERLRHKQRAVAPWDVERLVLQNFPEIYKAKCLPHTTPDSCEAPGHLTLIVIPSLLNRNAVDLLRPRADPDTLDRIKTYLENLTGPTVTVHTANPLYQTIQVAFKVQFQQQLDFGFYRKQLNAELVKFLSPWAVDGGSEIVFGGRLHKTVILQQVEQLAYVDYLIDFKLFQNDDFSNDLGQAQASDPRAILVSAADHAIQKL